MVSMSTVWITFGRPQNLPRRVPRNAVGTKTGFVGAPYPARAGPRRARVGVLVCRSRSHRPHTCGGGRVGITTEFRARLGGRPRLGGTPVRDETVPAGCPRNRRWSRSRPRLPPIRPRSAKPGHNGHIRPPCPGFGDHPPSRRVDLELPLFVVIPSQAKRTTASRVGTRQRRTRPRRACPQAGDGRRRNPGRSVLCANPATSTRTELSEQVDRTGGRALCSIRFRRGPGTARQAAFR
jgi:hypothetical protein